MSLVTRGPVTRGLATLVAVGATAVLAAGVLDPGALAAGPGVLADQPGARQVALAPLPATLVCPPAPRLQAEVADDAGGTDEDFQAAGSTSSGTVLRSLTPTGEAQLDGGTLPPKDAAGGTDLAATGTGTATLETDGEHAVVAQAAAAGLVAGLQVTTAEDGDLRGLAASSCVAPAETSWLVGGAVEAGRSGRVVLSNPSATTAVVDLTVLTPAGTLAPPAAQDLAVAGGTSREVLVESLLAPTATIAVGVTARGAAVAAQLVETHVAGVVPQGIEQVQAGAPGTDLVLPGVPVTGSATLRLANPGPGPAAVGWQVLASDGAVAVEQETVVTVPPGAAVDLPLALAGPGGAPVPGPVAVQVGADVPVLAAVEVEQPSSGGPSERAWVQPAPALQDRAQALALVPARGVRSSVTLAAGAAAAAVEVRLLDADGEPVGADLTLDLAPGTVQTRQVDGEVVAVRLRVRSGTLHAATTLTAAAPGGRGDELVAVVPVQVPPPTIDEVSVGALPDDVLLGPGTP